MNKIFIVQCIRVLNQCELSEFPIQFEKLQNLSEL